jgi:hypothetical protein
LQWLRISVAVTGGLNDLGRTVRAGRRLIAVKWMTITDAGRRALAE